MEKRRKVMHCAFKHGSSPRHQGVTLSLVLAAALILDGTQAFASPSCHPVQGTASLIPVPALDCHSPVAICGEGSFAGGLSGRYSSVLFTLTETADTPVTQVSLFTAETTIPLARVGHLRGALVFKEAGSFHTAGAGEFGELDSVSGGTKDFANATGVLKAVGTFDDIAGGSIVYQGEICVP
jgi:hypothetical protein